LDSLHLIHSHSSGTTDNYSAIAILHTFQFAKHALGFSVFTSRILATDLSESHCHFNSYLKSSWDSIIGFLPFPLNHLRLPFPELNPVLPTIVLNSFYCFSSKFRCPFMTPQHGLQGKHPCIVKEASLLVRYPAWMSYCRVRVCCGNVFTDPLPSNRYTSYTIINVDTRIFKSNIF
jgi:hypothetical protein